MLRPSVVTTLVLLVPACASPREPRDLRVDLAFSALPNFGLSVAGGQRIRETTDAAWEIEARATLQFLDDKSLASDGNPAAGDWTQFQLGFRRLSSPEARSHWTTTGGAVWFRATGEPNIVQRPGDYAGIYAGLGFETERTKHLRIGPEVSVLVVHMEKGQGIDVVPQLSWHFTFGF